MTQESLRDHAYSLRSDIHMFGMLIYETFTGKVPFDGVAVNEARERIINLERPDRLALSDGVWSVIEKCTRVDPSQRPRIAEVLEDLESPELTADVEAADAKVNADVEAADARVRDVARAERAVLAYRPFMSQAKQRQARECCVRTMCVVGVAVVLAVVVAVGAWAIAEHPLRAPPPTCDEASSEGPWSSNTSSLINFCDFYEPKNTFTVVPQSRMTICVPRRTLVSCHVEGGMWPEKTGPGRTATLWLQMLVRGVPVHTWNKSFTAADGHGDTINEAAAAYLEPGESHVLLQALMDNSCICRNSCALTCTVLDLNACACVSARMVGTRTRDLCVHRSLHAGVPTLTCGPARWGGGKARGGVL